MVAPTDRFVGRQRELETLRDAFEQALAARGRIVMLAGEPGIGKTRTAQELAHHAEQEARRCCGVAATRRPARRPIGHGYRSSAVRCVTATRGLLRDFGTGASDIADIVPEIRDISPGLEPLGPVGRSAQARFRMFESIRQFLVSLSRRQPALVVLDDLHWADAPSLAPARIPGT